MKTILISTSSLWNCGDDFIRNGVLNLLNLKSDVRTIWWNRANGVRSVFANDLRLNLRHCDYFVVAGTPTWINNTEYIYRYCLNNRIPIALIGVGSRGGIYNFRQKNLLHRLAASGLVEICLVRDELALEVLEGYGFKNVTLIPDPAFFVSPLAGDNSVSILGWRDYTVPEKVKLKDSARRLIERISGNHKEFSAFVKWYDRFMQDVFRHSPDPKIVVVHDNREIKRAEELFGKDHVFYSTDYREIFKVYSTAKTYTGSRIHGAIPSVVHGACVNLLYLIDKCRVLENSADILSKHVAGIKNSMKVVYLKDQDVSFPQDFVDTMPDRDAIHSALEKEKRDIRNILKTMSIYAS